MLKNLNDCARDVELVGNTLPQLDDGQTESTASRRHFVCIVLRERD